MADQKRFDPYETWKNMMIQWEKQANEMIHERTNNREFIRFSAVGLDLQARYLEMIQKNQQLMSNLLNVPTKSDISKIAKLSIQTDEKLDALEEQLWILEDSNKSSNKNIDHISDVSMEIIKEIKQLKTEMGNVREIRSELREMKRELAEINSLKEEIVSLKMLMANLAEHKRELATISK